MQKSNQLIVVSRHRPTVAVALDHHRVNPVHDFLSAFVDAIYQSVAMILFDDRWSSLWASKHTDDRSKRCRRFSPYTKHNWRIGLFANGRSYLLIKQLHKTIYATAL